MQLVQIKDIADTTVSHNAAIRKRVMIGQQFPPLTQFSQAVFPPQTVAWAHRHSDMLEVFFVQAGDGAIRINGVEYALPTGACIAVEPGESHELFNPSTTTDLVVCYFGVICPQPTIT